MAAPKPQAVAADVPNLDDFLCFAVYSANLAFNRVYKPRLDELNLTYPQYLVLVVLYEEDDQTVGNLGEKLFLDSSTLTPLLKRMEGMGLVKRTRSTEDERQVLVALTAQGHELKEKARTLPQSILSAAQCSISEIAAMKDEIVKLRNRLNVAIGEAG